MSEAAADFDDITIGPDTGTPGGCAARTAPITVCRAGIDWNDSADACTS